MKPGQIYVYNPDTMFEVEEEGDLMCPAIKIKLTKYLGDDRWSVLDIALKREYPMEGRVIFKNYILLREA